MRLDRGKTKTKQLPPKKNPTNRPKKPPQTKNKSKPPQNRRSPKQANKPPNIKPKTP